MNVVSAKEVANMFFDNWMFNYVPQTAFIDLKGKTFTSKFFLDICKILNAHNYFKKTYQSQPDRQVQRFH